MDLSLTSRVQQCSIHLSSRGVVNHDVFCDHKRKRSTEDTPCWSLRVVWNSFAFARLLFTRRSRTAFCCFFRSKFRMQPCTGTVLLIFCLPASLCPGHDDLIDLSFFNTASPVMRTPTGKCKAVQTPRTALFPPLRSSLFKLGRTIQQSKSIFWRRYVDQLHSSTREALTNFLA